VRAVVLEGPRRAVVREVAPPEVRAGEVLVGIERAGICGSDVAVFRGSRQVAYPLVMGHEAVGRVVDGSATHLSPGTRVALEPNIPCRACAACERGRGNVCASKRSLGMNAPGVFAELVAIDADFAHPLPTEIDLSDSVGIEPLAVALHAMRVGGVNASETVAVVGCGAEGLLLVQAARSLGSRVLALDVLPERLAAAQRGGAAGVALADPAAIAELCRTWSPEVVFEAAGAAAALELALDLAAPGGRVVAVGMATTPVALQPFGFVRKGLSLLSSLVYDHPRDFLAAIELVARGEIRPGALISKVADGLEELPAVLAMLADGQSTGKTVVHVA
jgi:2-desacetyl-2-hydroxyethyl bacteriochlorophyllide A dehydrogenase